MGMDRMGMDRMGMIHNGNDKGEWECYIMGMIGNVS
jgi:hypothetical protein